MLLPFQVCVCISLARELTALFVFAPSFECYTTRQIVKSYKVKRILL